MHSVNNKITERLEKYVNWRNCGCKPEGLYWYSWRPGAPANLEIQVLNMCWCKWLVWSTI